MFVYTNIFFPWLPLPNNMVHFKKQTFRSGASANVTVTFRDGEEPMDISKKTASECDSLNFMDYPIRNMDVPPHLSVQVKRVLKRLNMTGYHNYIYNLPSNILDMKEDMEVLSFIGHSEAKEALQTHAASIFANVRTQVLQGIKPVELPSQSASTSTASTSTASTSIASTSTASTSTAPHPGGSIGKRRRGSM